MAANPNLTEFAHIIKQYYKNFFFDNKNVLSYLDNIVNDSGNMFDETSKKILQLQINKNGSLLFFTDSVAYALYIRYSRVLYTISEAVQTLYYIIKNTNDYFDTYKVISIIQLSNEQPSISDTSSLERVANTDTTYVIDGNKLYIYNSSIVPLELNKTNYQINISKFIDDNTIIKNYLKFVLSFNDYNLKTQLYAFYYYLIMLNQFFVFYYKSERLLVFGANTELCNYADNMFVNNLSDLKGAIDALLNVSKEIAMYNITANCKSLCPVTFELIYTDDNDDIHVEKGDIFEENFIVIIDNKEYEILNTYYDTTALYYRKISSITLAANADDSSCQNSTNGFPILNVRLDEIKRISIRAKSVADVRKDYITIGKQLREANENIEKSKNKINKLVKSFTLQDSINKSIDMRATIYYVIFAIMFVLCIIIYFGNFEGKLKVSISIGIIFSLIIMIAINYYMGYDFIEQFMNSYVPRTIENFDTLHTTECNLLTSKSSVAERLNFIQTNCNLFMNYVIDIFTVFNLYLSSLDSIDLFRKLSGSIKSESHTFQQHETIYKYKEHISTKSIDIMKHEMIYKTAFVNMITYMVLILILLFVAYMYYPALYKTYLVITAILALVNLYVFYYSILHPVKTRSRNKYWSGLSDDTQVLSSK